MNEEKNVPENIKTIPLSMPFRLGSVNCYLIQTGASYVLIDTGGANQRAELEEALESAGCRPGDLNLIALTHGDFDHTGNAAYLRDKFDAPIAMHPDDAGMAERGDMFWNRKQPNLLVRLMAPLLPTLLGFGQSQRFRPDVSLEQGYDLAEYGLAARVLSIPGHSRGSIGILTEAGDLFCGDLLENRDEPALNDLIDDLAAAQASLEKLKSLDIKTVYPGHGQPFPLEQL